MIALRVSLFLESLVRCSDSQVFSSVRAVGCAPGVHARAAAPSAR
jgi:hypothetical protein